MAKRVPIREILKGPDRKRLLVGSIRALQNRAGIDTTQEQAEAAYDKVQQERTKTAK